MHCERDVNLADSYCRFCTAPLDVLKIRLQLQIHSLSDPITGLGPVRQARYSTVKTFKAILENEGVTVCFVSVNVEDWVVLTSEPGILERKRPRRAPIHILRRYSIFHLQSNYPVAPALSHDKQCRSVRLRRRRWSIGHNSYLPT